MSYFHHYCTGLDFPAFVLFAKKNKYNSKNSLFCSVCQNKYNSKNTIFVLCAKTKTPKIPFLFFMQKKMK